MAMLLWPSSSTTAISAIPILSSSQVRATIHSSTLQVIVAGDAAELDDLETMSRDDLQRVEVYALPIALLLISSSLARCRPAGLPLALGLCSVVQPWP